MSFRFLTVLAVVPGLLAAIPIVGVAAVHAAGAPSPQSIALRPVDLQAVYGGRFKLLQSMVVPNSQATILPSTSSAPTAAVYGRHGRITGYLTFLARSGAKTGVLQAYSSVDRYRDTAGPRWAINYSGATRTKTRRTVTQHVQQVRGIGEAASLATYTSTAIPSVLEVVSFRRGRFLVTIGITLTGKLRTSDSLRLARIADRRITGH